MNYVLKLKHTCFSRSLSFFLLSSSESSVSLEESEPEPEELDSDFVDNLPTGSSGILANLEKLNNIGKLQGGKVR